MVIGIQLMRQHTSAYVSIRQHTSAYASMRHPAYVSIRQRHTLAIGIKLMHPTLQMLNVLRLLVDEQALILVHALHLRDHLRQLRLRVKQLAPHQPSSILRIPPQPVSRAHLRLLESQIIQYPKVGI
jgi:hypothetical protein